jgi:Lytic polysaccharide mono-oxygenase, cellulose-degrading
LQPAVDYATDSKSLLFCCSLSLQTATYTQGQTITTTQTLTANHGGYLRIKVCPNSPGAATQACFDQNVLQGPTGSKYWITSGTYMNSPPYTIAWTLPAGVSAEHVNYAVNFEHCFRQLLSAEHHTQHI